jgi:MFS family permease
VFKKLLILIITAFVDMVGLLMILAVDAVLCAVAGRKRIHGDAANHLVHTQPNSSARRCGADSLIGTDAVPALLVGLGAAAIAYVVFALANSLWLLLLSRVVQGAGGGTVGVIQATSQTLQSQRIAREHSAGFQLQRMLVLRLDLRLDRLLSLWDRAGPDLLLRLSASPT